MPFTKVKVLSIFAHIDDHICFGWPIMQDEEIERHLIVCTNDGGGVLQKSCEDAGIHLYGTLGLQDGFYRKNAGHLGQIQDFILSQLKVAIEQIGPDWVFTHNPWGEYGHFDHQFLYQAVYKLGCPRITSDILVKSLSFPLPNKEIYQDNFLAVKQEVVLSDSGFYAHQTKLFRKLGQWTSNKHLDKPSERCRLYFHGATKPHGRNWLENVCLPSLAGSVLFVGVNATTRNYCKLVKHPARFQTLDNSPHSAKWGSPYGHYGTDFLNFDTKIKYDNVVVYGLDPTYTPEGQVWEEWAQLLLKKADSLLAAGGVLVFGGNTSLGYSKVLHVVKGYRGKVLQLSRKNGQLKLDWLGIKQKERK